MVLTTTSTLNEARKLADGLVNARFAACVQILPEMTSIYSWEGEICEESERLLLIKTTEEKYGEVELFIQENHSYDVPEIVAIPAEKVSEKYLGWLSGYVGSS